MNVVILSAGRGTRFEESLPKCLCPLGTETVISRQIRQIRTYLPDANITVVTGFEGEWVRRYCQSFDSNVRICYNDKFKSDKNIYSCLIGLDAIEGGCLILEGDCIFSDKMFEGVYDRLRRNDDDVIFFLGKPAEASGLNGVIGTGPTGRFLGYTIGTKTDVTNSYNMAGATWIPSSYCSIFKKDLRRLSSLSMSEYYFEPLVRPGKKYNVYTEVLGDECYTFNTKEAYLSACEELGCNPKVELFEASKLKHIEDYSRDAVAALTDKIRAEGRWVRPLCISKEGLVMDGQHRMEVAKNLGLSKVPVIIYNYNQVPIYSLREDYSFTYKDVVRRAGENSIYPYKTVKHVFNEDDLRCDYALEDLK